MKQRFAITSYHGQHDEAGAVITELATGKQFMSTPSIEDGDWTAYHAKNEFVLNALNGHEGLVHATRTLLHCVNPKDKEPEAFVGHHQAYVDQVAVPRAEGALKLAGAKS